MRYYIESDTLFIRGSFRAASTGAGGGIRSVSSLLNHTNAPGQDDDPEKVLEIAAANAGIGGSGPGVAASASVEVLKTQTRAYIDGNAHVTQVGSANIDASDTMNVRVSGGSVKDDVEVGMDENGTVGVGSSIPDDANLSIDGSGSVRVGVPPVANASSNGRVVVGVKDKTTNLSSVTGINVTIDSVSVHSSSGGWVTLSSAPKTFDLLGLNANGSEQLLAESGLAHRHGHRHRGVDHAHYHVHDAD